MNRISELDLTGKMDFPCISEEHYNAQMQQIVEPYLNKYKETGVCHGLYYELFLQENPKGTIVISHGYTESCEKYHEAIYYFHKRGFQTAMVDHRGHGKSTREVEKKCLVHIDSFSKYVEDLHGFISEKVVPLSQGKPLYLYAHSMGGCIGSLYLEQHPTVFSKAILNAPMLGIQMGGMPRWMAILVCRFFLLTGKGKERIFFMEEFKEEEPFSMSASSSRARHAFYREIQKNQEDYQTCCSTYSWMAAALQAGKQALKQENIRRIQIPVLLFQATEDTFVTPKEQVRFINALSDGELVTVNSRHEIWRADNAVMEAYWAKVFSFYDK